MFRELEEAIRIVERSNRKVELRIKARAQAGTHRDSVLATAPDAIPRARLKVSRFREQGRTIYTSGPRSWKK